MKKIFIVLLVIIASVISLFSANINLNTCKSCHGQKFQKKALGMSKIVKDLNSTEISKALIGYKNGIFSSPMKEIMKNQVSKYSYKELKQIAKDIKK